MPGSNFVKKGPGRGTCLKPCPVGKAIDAWCRVSDVREIGANAGRGLWGEVVEGKVGGMLLDGLASTGPIDGLDDGESGRPSIGKRREPSIRMMFEPIANSNGNDGELLAEGGPNATKAMEVRRLATMLPKSESRIESSTKVTMSFSLATTKIFSSGKFIGLGGSEGVDEGDDPVGAPHAPTSDGRALEEHPGKPGTTVPHRASDGSTGGSTSLNRPRAQGKDLIASEASSRSHEGLELGEPVGNKHHTEAGGADEGVEDLGEARVVDDELGDGSLIGRKLTSSGELEGDRSMVADELLVTQGRVAKQPSTKSELQHQPGR